MRFLLPCFINSSYNGELSKFIVISQFEITREYIMQRVETVSITMTRDARWLPFLFAHDDRKNGLSVSLLLFTSESEPPSPIVGVSAWASAQEDSLTLTSSFMSATTSTLEQS